jgi:hypothetical protein
MTKKVKLPPSEGIRKRLGRPVRDADDPITLPLTQADLARAIRKRRAYDIDEPENFTACALAECFGKVGGAEFLIMRRVAFAALPGEKFTRRYVLDTPTQDVVKANDLDRLATVPANMTASLLPATPGRRLVAQGGKRVSKQSRGILANPPRPHPDPYRGVVRNGVHANG